ncbi:MAG: lytic murein transglycosylase B [Gammaproteobacteria bacterium 39-13]|nr:lytic murein transglycosylase B [Gammaproteobacteria bacterium]OJV96018.1 MAG: lytic murein transglycosylase B [Gammaproteobacteria bacterium 39-13]
MQKKIISLISVLFLSLITSFHVIAAPTNTSLTERPDVKAFIQDMKRKHHFDEQLLKKWLGQAKIQSSIITTMTKPAEKKPWYKYQAIFLSPQRINDGVTFWQANKAALAKAEKEYGIPPEIVIAIIGVETFYGKHAGQYSVLDALVTLGFDYPPRSKFFLSELEEFLLLAREEKWDPTQIKGSYAGAMGKPQFIASSYRRYAVDFNHTGRRDLLNNVDDAIGSVANYFKVHGWKKGDPIVFPAQVQGDKFKTLIASKSNPKPDHSWQTISQSGVKASADPKKLQGQSFALISLEGTMGPQYWLGAQNFYVITRYNHSDHYAMAVYELSQKIKEAYKQT